MTPDRLPPPTRASCAGLINRARTLRMLALAMAMALLGSPFSVPAREVRALWFSFEIPDSWIVEGDGGEKLFATGAKQAYSPPLILGEACISSANSSCMSSSLPDPPTEFTQQGCANATPQRFTRSNGILETRWACSAVTISGARTTTGISIFRFNGSILYLAYIAGDTDAEVSDFLEQLARSLAVKP